MLIAAVEMLRRRLGDLFLGPVVRAADLTADCCSAAILADLRWSALALAAPGKSPALGASPMGCDRNP